MKSPEARQNTSPELDGERLIEVAFPLRETSIDSVHEKNVRHGHLSTLHVWPARRPLAACRAALVTALLPDPGNSGERTEILKRLAGKVTEVHKKEQLPSGETRDVVSRETSGGILHWGRESGPDLDWFRKRIKAAYGGRVPRVLDSFAGGGAIPLEAMRLGCKVTASDINPVAWFVLRCTLEYPQRLAGQTRELPQVALQDAEFMAEWRKVHGLRPPGPRRGQTRELLPESELEKTPVEANLAWHVRAWGRWVLKRARRDLAHFYPTYAEYCSLKPYRQVPLDSGDALRLVPTNAAGESEIDILNAGVDRQHLQNPAKPRWVAKQTVAYLWARTLRCKACRAELPLLKTCWLAKTRKKRVLLHMRPREDGTGVDFDIEANPEARGRNATERPTHDKDVGAGTMSRAGATCPCCGTVMTMDDIRLEGQADRRGAMMVAVVVESPNGKEYRRPTQLEVARAREAGEKLDSVFAKVPFGLPDEPTPKGGGGAARAFSVDAHGIDKWRKLFLPRQLLALGILVKAVRALADELGHQGYSGDWKEAVVAYNAIVLDKTADYGSSICTWHNSGEKMGHTFARFALPMVWDTAELAVANSVGSSWTAQLHWVARYIEHALAGAGAHEVTVEQRSAIEPVQEPADIIITDPPYYDAIPYSDLMDFFHIWLRRTLSGLSPEYDAAFARHLSPKWNQDANDGELIDDTSRFEGDAEASKRNYEQGMARTFKACHASLQPHGRLVIVFAHKHPDAWETLVGAIMKAGFVVTGSWPIQTEMGTRMRAFSSAALASSVWLVCRKRDPMARAGWDEQVLQNMQENIVKRLRDFWDAGVRGPDFVWAATGPALEAYSRYPAVKKIAQSGALMSVNEFLVNVRRMVVDFVVGRVLSGDGGDDQKAAHTLDNITTYYLLHRNTFQLVGAPAGPCILYMISCGLSERELSGTQGLLARGSGVFRLRAWAKRKHPSLGEDSAAPLIDQLHRTMHLWKSGDLRNVYDYIDRHGLHRNRMFGQLVQALIEQSRNEEQNDECALLERIANHLKDMGVNPQGRMF